MPLDIDQLLSEEPTYSSDIKSIPVEEQIAIHKHNIAVIKKADAILDRIIARQQSNKDSSNENLRDSS